MNKFIQSLTIEYGYVVAIAYEDGYWWVDALDMDYNVVGIQEYDINLDMAVEKLWRTIHQRGG